MRKSQRNGNKKLLTYLTSGSQLSFNAKLADVWRTKMKKKKKNKKWVTNNSIWIAMKLNKNWFSSLSLKHQTFTHTQERTFRTRWNMKYASWAFMIWFLIDRVTERETFYCSIWIVFRVFISYEWMNERMNDISINNTGVSFEAFFSHLFFLSFAPIHHWQKNN